MQARISQSHVPTCSWQSTHFPEEMSYHQIGQKVVAVNVSDLAAMGSESIGIIVSMGLPETCLLKTLMNWLEGILDACKKYDMALIGGDTNESNELTLCGTCIGNVKKENVLMKSGAIRQEILLLLQDNLDLQHQDSKCYEYKPDMDDHKILDMFLKHAPRT